MFLHVYVFFYSMGNLKKNKLSQILTKDVGNTIKDLMSPNFYLCHECTNGNSCTQCIANVYESELTKTNCNWRTENERVLKILNQILKPIQ